jgi:23S rRNA pseudouridine2605 synthase
MSKPAAATVRLNKFVAASGVCSRREADEFIVAGVVTVNGVVVTELGSRVAPGDVVRFNDEPLSGERKVYILMNKPKGFVTTVEDPHADRTVVDIVRGKCPERVYPVGRLDKNSVGVLLLTNDGELTRQLTHPSYNKKKIYQATLDHPLTRADMDSIAAGVELEDGPIVVDAVSWVDSGRREVGVEIHSGRNRIVRRIFEHFGYKIVKLDRVYFAGLTKEGLRRGQWKFLTPQEIAMLKSGRYE